ncbi:HAD-IA family hydrolase [bacterium]|nr:HAD-IA family hydrolase [bacterium]
MPTRRIKGIVFDFDGLIVDTELPLFETWQELYQENGGSLPLDFWEEVIGRSDAFDPYETLESQLGHPIDREAIRAEKDRRYRERLARQEILPGVLDKLNEAAAAGLQIGLASSSDYQWVDGHLRQFDLRDRFECVFCKDHVARTKPNPELYLKAVEALELAPSEAIAIEDSPNGARAAVAAGLFTVVVPNTLTRSMKFNACDLRLESLADRTLAELIEIAQAAS